MDRARNPKVLVVDDEAHIRKFLRISLSAHGYVVLEASRGEDAIRKCASEFPDIVVLDLGLPDMDGQQVVGRIREWSQVPMIVLSVRAGEMDKVAALESGANDYVTKPFGIAELIARLRALLRDHGRHPGSGEKRDASFHSGPLIVDYASRQIVLNGNVIHVTRKEFDLLSLLTRHAGEVLTHEVLLRSVWGDSYAEETQYLRVHIGRLRQKLDDDPIEPKFIWTEPGVGYRFIFRD